MIGALRGEGGDGGEWKGKQAGCLVGCSASELVKWWIGGLACGGGRWMVDDVVGIVRFRSQSLQFHLS